MRDQYGAERELAMSLKQPVVSVLGEFESASSPNLVNSHADSEFTLSAPSRAYSASGAKADGRVHDVFGRLIVIEVQTEHPQYENHHHGAEEHRRREG
jgi:hypothetical protein